MESRMWLFRVLAFAVPFRPLPTLILCSEQLEFVGLFETILLPALILPTGGGIAVY